MENLSILQKYDKFEFKKEDIINTNIISEFKPEKVCHLASMAGVRYSIENPDILQLINSNKFTWNQLISGFNLKNSEFDINSCKTYKNVKNHPKSFSNLSNSLRFCRAS